LTGAVSALRGDLLISPAAPGLNKVIELREPPQLSSKHHPSVNRASVLSFSLLCIGPGPSKHSDIYMQAMAF
jgi:hypothetical protein